MRHLVFVAVMAGLFSVKRKPLYFTLSDNLPGLVGIKVSYTNYLSLCQFYLCMNILHWFRMVVLYVNHHPMTLHIYKIGRGENHVGFPAGEHEKGLGQSTECTQPLEGSVVVGTGAAPLSLGSYRIPMAEHWCYCVWRCTHDHRPAGWKTSTSPGDRH